MNEKKPSTNTDNWVFFSYLTKILKQSTKYFKQIITNGLETTENLSKERVFKITEWKLQTKKYNNQNKNSLNGLNKRVKMTDDSQWANKWNSANINNSENKWTEPQEPTEQKQNS